MTYKERYQKLRAAGLCTKCGKNPTNKTLCDVCKSNCRKYYKNKKDKGICVKCNQTAKVGKYCEVCYDKYSRMPEYNRRKQNKLCVICQTPILGDNVRCEQCLKSRSEKIRNRRADDIQFRIANNLRRRLRSVLNGKTKSGSSIDLLGCSIEDLCEHLESKFTEGMSWDNFNRDGWWIDHIKPLCSFDLTNFDELSKACHFTNLQPLWAVDNMRKGGKY